MKQTREQVAEYIKKWVIVHLGLPDSNYSEESSFEDMGADSLDSVEIVMEVESHFNITINDEDVDEAATTPKQLIDYIIARL